MDTKCSRICQRGKICALFVLDIGDGLRLFRFMTCLLVLVVVECSVEEHDIATFMSQLEESHILGLDDLDYDGCGCGGDDEE